ncbi:hypothetical protein [uncultured Aquimarina sp.]|uniref:hypothetical protein n=1 Tax=uncultured Aquimarina sp. TaxID=575652 RepID=UPI002637A74C|nr:hypothetical protein [uncultured Aquimarina sp.]
MKSFLIASLGLFLLYGCEQNQKDQDRTPTPTTDTFVKMTKADTIVDRTFPDPDSPDPKVMRVYEKLNFGNGYNSSTGQEYFGVFDFDGIVKGAEISAGARGNSGQITVDRVSTQEDLKESLDISAKAELDFTLGNWSSQNELKVNVLNETEFSSFSDHLLIKAEYVNEPLVLIKPKIKPALMELAKNDPETFIRTCGDMFVSRIYTGGELFTLYTMHTRNTREKEKVNVFFKTTNQYLGVKVNGEIDVDKVKKNQESTESINTTIISRGGGPTPRNLNIESFLEYAAQFKEDVSADKRAVILYVEMSPYESIAGFPDIDFSKIRVVQRKVLEDAGHLLAMVKEAKGNIEFVRNNQDLFSEEDIIQCDIEEQLALKYDLLLRKIISDCREDPNSCHIKDLNLFEDYDGFAPDIELPEWEGEATPLPLATDQGWTSVFTNTQKDELILSIQGDMEIRRNDKTTEVDCRQPTYKTDKRLITYYNQNDTFWKLLFGGGPHYLPIYEEYTYPYYQVQYVSKETNKIVQTLNYTGPLKPINDVEIRVQLVNPSTRLLFKKGNKYIPVNSDIIKKIGYNASPFYKNIRSCKMELPVSAIVVDANIEPRKEKRTPKMMSSNMQTVDRNIKRPRVKLIDGVYQYDYSEYWENN